MNIYIFISISNWYWLPQLTANSLMLCNRHNAVNIARFLAKLEYSASILKGYNCKPNPKFRIWNHACVCAFLTTFPSVHYRPYHFVFLLSSFFACWDLGMCFVLHFIYFKNWQSICLWERELKTNRSLLFYC